MMKYFVEWTMVDDYYGRHDDTGDYKWFDTEEEMEEWIAWKKKHNGSYFQMFRKGRGNYAKWLRILDLYEKIEEMKNDIKNLYANIELP